MTVSRRFRSIALFSLLACNGTLTLIGDRVSGPDSSAPPDSSLPPDAGGDALLCTVESECVAASLHCEPISHTCVECMDDVPCAPSGLVCDLTVHQCVQCRAQMQDCPSGQNCDAVTQQCVAPCAGGCPAVTPVCDSALGYCVACEGDTDCTNPAKSHCSPSGKCVGCPQSAHCSALKPYCLPGTSVCVQCLSSSDCPPGKPTCDATGSCVK